MNINAQGAQAETDFANKSAKAADRFAAAVASQAKAGALTMEPPKPDTGYVLASLGYLGAKLDELTHLMRALIFAQLQRQVTDIFAMPPEGSDEQAITHTYEFQGDIDSILAEVKEALGVFFEDAQATLKPEEEKVASDT